MPWGIIGNNHMESLETYIPMNKKKQMEKIVDTQENMTPLGTKGNKYA